jgi:deoxyribose-phosphate aldolase
MVTMTEPLRRADVARMIDHTLLKPEATTVDVERLCAEAAELGVLAVCISPSMVPVAKAALVGRAVRLASVCGFPSGAHQPSVKATEAARSVEQGADEIDVVVDLAHAKAGQWSVVERELALVRAAVPAPTVLKVIVESALLTPEELDACCLASVAAGADFVKTSTGYHPAGGATVDAVRAMRKVVGPDVGVKASGGIRTAEQAVAMIEAGANRIGCSATAAILAGLPA